MKATGWLDLDFTRDLHQENIELGLHLHLSIEPGLLRKDLQEITDLPTKKIHTETDLPENPGEKPQLTQEMTLQTDIGGNPAILDRRLLEDPGLQEPEVRVGGLLHFPVTLAEAEAEAKAMDQPRELLGDTTPNWQCLPPKLQCLPEEKSGSASIRGS